MILYGLMDKYIPPPPPPPSKIISRYYFENNGNDSVGTYNLVPASFPSYSNSIFHQGSYSFGPGYNAGGGYFTSPSELNTLMSNKTDYMIDFWFYTTYDTTGVGGNTWWEASNLNSFTQNFMGRIRWVIQGKVTSPVECANVPLNEWIRVTLRSTASLAQIYLNGLLSGSQPYSGNLGTVTSMSFGKYAGGSQGGNKGETYLDDTSFINSSDIADLP